MTSIASGRGSALARAALAGNPSDGYGGAVLAVTLPHWAARAEASPGRSRQIEPANALVEATVDRFTRELDPRAADAAVHWTTSIPQRVGLGSSSALVIAVTRALCQAYAVDLEPTRLAEFALAVETEELGIVAGLQDRVAQAFEGLTFMEFADPPSYQPLDPALLPPLVVAWREETAAHSGDVHGRLRERHRDGDQAVRQTMNELADAARRARDALLEGDRQGFGACVDRTLDGRQKLTELDPLCLEMVDAARAGGAAANYTGSGGAIVAVCADEAHAETVFAALERIGCPAVRV